MPVNNRPHATWADVYDFAYQQVFGESYEELTERTLGIVEKYVSPPAKIVDFGAGTGRLSIPLAEKGYEVTAVEPCEAMLEQLEKKKERHEGLNSLNTIRSTMQEFKNPKNEKYDLALCVFTVVSYLLDEESLRKALSVAYDVLKPGGGLFLDIPHRVVFNSYRFNNNTVNRRVTVTNTEGDIYRYKEQLLVNNPNEDPAEYSDEFLIRYWSPQYVKELLGGIGFDIETDFSDWFANMGSDYWLLKRADA